MDRKYVFYCCEEFIDSNCPEPYCIASVDLSVKMFAPKLYATGIYLYSLDGSKHEYWDALNYPRAIYIDDNSYIFDSLDEAVAFAANKYTPCPD